MNSACESLELVCGTGNCTVDCQELTRPTDVCKDLKVDTSTYFLNTSNFKCIGDCPSFTEAPTCRYCNYCGRPRIIQLEYSMQSELSITHNQYIIN